MSMPANTHAELTDLAQVIAAIRSPRFASVLIDYLQHYGDFDCAVILGYSQTRRPVYLYDNLQQQRDLLFQRYLQGTYQHDPFYRSFMNGLSPGVYSLADIVSGAPLADGVLPDEYLEHFYHETGWQHELDVVIQLDDTRWVGMFLGLLHRDLERFRQMQGSIQQRFAVIAALSQQHWHAESFLLASAPQLQFPMQSGIREHLRTFAQALLTPQEQRVAQLILQGLSSAEIARQLAIGVGTVKNHRKHLYAKLHINSEAALFGLFLDGLMVVGP